MATLAILRTGVKTMLDRHGREIDYLRISITDRCNLRCRYCMPAEGIDCSHAAKILSLENIVRLVKVGVQAGIRKVRITGGEPLVRKNVTGLIAKIADIPEVEDISLTTNGVLFADMAERLSDAGLTRVNFSLDSLDSNRFEYITRLGKLHNVLDSITKAMELGLSPIKVNTVVMKGFNDDEILNFAKLAYDYPLHIRFIEFMPIGNLPFYREERLVTAAEIKSTVEQQFSLTKTTTVQGDGPAKYYKPDGGAGTIGFISPMSNHFCGECNRIRMTADGQLRGCLFGKEEVNLGLALQNDASDELLLELFVKAIKGKPHCHQMSEGWGIDNRRKMYQIGG